MSDTINFRLNGEAVRLTVPPLKRLVDILRDDLNLTGTKEGCGEGQCGACSVLVDGRLANSCLIPAALLAGRSIVTIEGYRNSARFDHLKACFEKAGALQCGFCTPGMILAAEALLCQNPKPTQADVRVALAGNLCRCTGYNMIVEAVLLAAREGGKLWSQPTGL
ncbi:MAG TPA: (2Fe-2S)-binding protein [Desulfitobacteriaceae bacterium]|nr:(2Fe-2S)-binding protein [Desulfitobacteriaceae bacterium]